MQISWRQLSALILREVLVVNRGGMEQQASFWMHILAAGNSVLGSACIIEAFVTYATQQNSEWK